MKPRTIDDYGGDITSASFSALLELETTLRSYKDSLVLIGGWVPFLLIEKFGRKDTGFRHSGSIDIDFAVNPDTVGSDGYARIVELIEGRDYVMKRSKDGQPVPGSYIKSVESTTNGKPFIIQVDFLTTPEPHKTSHRHRRVQPDLPARKTEGCDLAFLHNMRTAVYGKLPGNGETKLELLMLDIAGCIGMKGVVLGDRYNEKDAYDIFSVVSQCHERPSAIAALVRPYSDEPSMRRGLDTIRTKFGNIRSDGPTWVGMFRSPIAGEQQKRYQAEAFATVSEFVTAL
jgi:hypothetical protein